MKFPALGLLFSGTAILAGLPGPAAAEVPIPHLFVAPTAGVFRWDQDAYRDLELEGRTSEAWGGRAGFTPISAFSGEIVVLTGTQRAVYHAADTTAGVSIQATQVELSLGVNFQTLVRAPVYPFLNLGVGVVIRRGDLVVAGEDLLDAENAAFHLGGGVRWDASDQIGLRANFRDTFFSDTLEVDGREEQVTVDSVEISLSVDLRIALGKGEGGKDRLR